MKITTLWLAILLVSLTGCVTSTPNRHSSPAPPKKLDPPESVIVYYYVKPGQEGALEDTLARLEIFTCCCTRKSHQASRPAPVLAESSKRRAWGRCGGGWPWPPRG
jgi:hypothetical protein